MVSGSSFTWRSSSDELVGQGGEPFDELADVVAGLLVDPNELETEPGAEVRLLFCQIAGSPSHFGFGVDRPELKRKKEPDVKLLGYLEQRVRRQENAAAAQVQHVALSDFLAALEHRADRER